MGLFRATLEECCLSDLGFSGPRFTWSNCRGAGQFTEEQLDRATANLEWCERFRHAVVSVLAARSLDHNPLWVLLSKTPRNIRRQRQFKFEAS